MFVWLREEGRCRSSICCKDSWNFVTVELLNLQMAISALCIYSVHKTSWAQDSGDAQNRFLLIKLAWFTWAGIHSPLQYLAVFKNVIESHWFDLKRFWYCYIFVSGIKLSIEFSPDISPTQGGSILFNSLVTSVVTKATVVFSSCCALDCATPHIKNMSSSGQLEIPPLWNGSSLFSMNSPVASTVHASCLTK